MREVEAKFQAFLISTLGKGKDKVHPRTSHEVPEGE
jgi:hypothetical protein